MTESKKPTTAGAAPEEARDASSGAAREPGTVPGAAASHAPEESRQPDTATGPSDGAAQAADEVEADLELARLAQERDEYLDALRRLQADFENYKKRIIKQQTEHLQRAAQDLVEKLLPVLDAVDLARAHGVADEAGGGGLEQVGNALFDILQKEG